MGVPATVTTTRELTQPLRSWTPRNWAAAVAVAVTTVVVVGVPTDLIDTPLFSREVPPTWWSWPVLVLTAVLTGLLVGTYVANPTITKNSSASSLAGGLGGLLSFFAVGCPVCNKLVLLAVGSNGAFRWFQPVQPVLSVAGLLLLGWAVVTRLRSANACPTPRSIRRSDVA